MNTYVIGHEKPDVDSVVAAIALAKLFKTDSCFGYENPIAVLASEINNETAYVLERFGIKTPPILTEDMLSDEDQFVLVDHNEETQRSKLVQESRVVEIIDHHKVSFKSESPIYMTFKPWGSTATIITWMFEKNDIGIDDQTAQLLLSAILSDTVGMQSATTTEKDREYVAMLAEKAGVSDIKELTTEIFKAKSDIGSLSEEEMVRNDYKVFDFSGKKVFIGQLETVQQNEVLTQKEALIRAMESIKQDEGLDEIFLAISDILAVNTQLLFANGNEQMIAEKAFGVEAHDDHILDIGAKLSRKKEIAPAIEQAIKEL